MPEPPWFTKPWVNLASGRRGVVAAALYTLWGLCLVLLALVSEAAPILRLLELVAGAFIVGLGLTIGATLRWRRAHGVASH